MIEEKCNGSFTKKQNEKKKNKIDDGTIIIISL